MHKEKPVLGPADTGRFLASEWENCFFEKCYIHVDTHVMKCYNLLRNVKYIT